MTIACGRRRIYRDRFALDSDVSRIDFGDSQRQRDCETMKKCLLLAACVLAAFTAPAHAASAVVFGERTVVARSAANPDEAVRQATERCGRADANCRLLFSCAERGFGYVAAAQVGAFIESVGGICGQASMETARDKAMELCKRNAQTAPCALKSTWLDR